MASTIVVLDIVIILIINLFDPTLITIYSSNVIDSDTVIIGIVYSVVPTEITISVLQCTLIVKVDNWLM